MALVRGASGGVGITTLSNHASYQVPSSRRGRELFLDRELASFLRKPSSGIFWAAGTLDYLPSSFSRFQRPAVSPRSQSDRPSTPTPTWLPLPEAELPAGRD